MCLSGFSLSRGLSKITNHTDFYAKLLVGGKHGQKNSDDALAYQGSGKFLSGSDIFKSRSYFVHSNFMDINLNKVLKLDIKNKFGIGKPDEPKKSGYSQSRPQPYRIWKLTGCNASIFLRGTYGQNQTKQDNVIAGKASGASLTSGISLNTRSYFVHPNFTDISLSGSYNPSINSNYAVGMPNYTEKSDLAALDYSIQFFKKQKFVLITNGGFSNGNSNFDYISRIKYKNSYSRTFFSLPNKIVPFTLSYNYSKLEQKIIESNRLFGTTENLFRATAEKSFTDFDNTSISYDHSNFSSYQNDVSNNYSYRNRIYFDMLNINNNISFFLDKKKNYNFRSNISSTNSFGNLKISNLMLSENLSMKLPKRFFWTNNYTYGIVKQDLYSQGSNISYNQSFQSALSHQLYSSLSTQVMYGYNEGKSNGVFRQQNNSFGGNVTYSKIIPYGHLQLNYSYNKIFTSITTPPTTLYIAHERYLLSDGTTTLLSNQHVDMASIVVTDVTGTIVYILNTDYLLINNDPVIEIVRIPGGAIPNNTDVYIDYSAVKPGNLKYTSNTHVFFANVLLFKNRLNLSYTFSKQNFYDVSSASEVQILNYYLRHQALAQVDFVFIKAGVEYDYSKSSISPYYGMRYFIKYQQIFYRRISVTANADMLDRLMLDEAQRRQDIEFSCKLAYAVNENIVVNTDYSYRKMTGRGINLDLQTAKLVVSANVRKLHLSLGTDFYLSSYFSTKISYKGAYIQLIRNF